MPEQVIDFRNHRRGQDETPPLSLNQLSGALVPVIGAVVIGVDDAGVENDRHSAVFTLSDVCCAATAVCCAISWSEARDGQRRQSLMW